MTRLIDADALMDDIRKHAESYFAEDFAHIWVDEQPTVDAEPVRHGKWIVEYEVKDGRSMRCSECQMVFWVGSGRDGNYCPNCGAKMDKQEKQNDS